MGVIYVCNVTCKCNCVNVTANTFLTLQQLYVNIKGLVISGYNKGQRFNIWNLRR